MFCLTIEPFPSLIYTLVCLTTNAGLPQMIEPSYALDLGNDSTEPKKNLMLASVRGIRSQGLTRGALAYNRLGGLIYPAATIGVVYSRKMHRCVRKVHKSKEARIQRYVQFISYAGVVQCCGKAPIHKLYTDVLVWRFKTSVMLVMLVMLVTSTIYAFVLVCLPGSISRLHRTATPFTLYSVMPNATSLRTLGALMP